MIRTVEVPQSVTRMGCTPGGDCCDECKSHGPAAQPTGERNIALRRALGDVSCTADGNCYDVTATVSYGDATAAPSSPAAGGISKNMLYIGGAILMVLLLEGSSRR